MTRTDEYEAELTGDRAEIASILEGVADGVRAGDVRLGDDADAVSVALPEELTLELELENEDDELSLELELEWPASAEGSSVSPLEEPIEGEVESAEEEADESSEGGEEPSDGEEAEPAGEAIEDVEPTLAGPVDGPQSMARFEVYRDRASEWRWRLRHRNGNVIATSGEGYTRKHNALKGLRSVVANSPGAELSE